MLRNVEIHRHRHRRRHHHRRRHRYHFPMLFHYLKRAQYRI